MFNLLVVEDEYWMSEGLCNIIHNLNNEFVVTDVAQNGEEALDKISHKHFDVIITDIRMPIMDGLDLIEKMKELKYNQPVIIITGHSEFEYARRAFRLGAIDYLLKPIKSDELKEVLENLKSQHLKSIDMQKNMIDQSQEGKNDGVHIIKYTLDLINSKYMEDLSLSEIADDVGFNGSYLSRLFKMETGKGFVQYLREVRIQHAKDMLTKTESTIENISKEVGFQSEKHFRRIFKKDLGLTPSDYRELQQCKK
ncbi:response regulator [Gracilibacillus sp. YIM 98692]|uniref:response regulator transcription factor n=1 Tax=Gracilibacillus sp. YIM 98692 TaxID=2663532 RepID=UPI0013D71231|nr:response regulator [Gracilibacillus sp. YIM 98692]